MKNAWTEEIERLRKQLVDLEQAVKVFQDDTKMRKAHIEHLEGQIVTLKERERILTGRLQSHGDIETDKEEALRGREAKDEPR